MAIIEANHVTKEYKLGQLTSLKHTALDDIAMSSFSRENRELAPNPIDP